MKRLLPILPLGALLLVTMGVGPCDSEPLGNVDGGASCTYAGKTHAAGTTFASTDGCNTCSCEGGSVACTLKGCATGDGGAGKDAGPVCIDTTGEIIPCPGVDAGNICFDVSGNVIACPDGGGIIDTGPICVDAISGKIIPCSGVDAGTDAATTCQYNGARYVAGTTFPSADGCNSCSCTSDGLIACTQRACFDAGTDTATYCDYGGTRYAAGATFPSSDGCNSCSCSASGVACTHKTCLVNDGGIIGGACTFGLDQTCNENPTVSALRGKCQPDGTCICDGGGSVSPYTGRCLDPGDTVGNGCEYLGKLQPVGSTFTCADGCSVCTCVAPGKIAMNSNRCPDGGALICGFDAIYIYGSVGGHVASQDQVTIVPASSTATTSYVLNRTTANGTSGISCSPPLPSCGDPSLVDVADIMADITDPVVQKFLGLPASPPWLFGMDTRPVDGPIFSILRGDGHGFLVGAPCNGASACMDIPPTISKLVSDLHTLDSQQLRAPACAALASTK